MRIGRGCDIEQNISDRAVDDHIWRHEGFLRNVVFDEDFFRQNNLPSRDVMGNRPNKIDDALRFAQVGRCMVNIHVFYAYEDNSKV